VICKNEVDERRALQALRSERPILKNIEQVVLFMRQVEASYADGTGLQSVTQGILEQAAEFELYGCYVEDGGHHWLPEASVPIWVQHGALVRSITRGVEGLQMWYNIQVKGRTQQEISDETGVRQQRISETVGRANAEILRRLENV